LFFLVSFSGSGDSLALLSAFVFLGLHQEKGLTTRHQEIPQQHHEDNLREQTNNLKHPKNMMR